MKRALIIGHSGQDGSYLLKFLESLHYEVAGISSSSSYSNFGFPFQPGFSISNAEAVQSLVKELKADEIYYLAAVHHASSDNKGDDHNLFMKSFQVNVLSFVHFLDAISRYTPAARIFYAASSHVFGNVNSERQNEQTPLQPVCIYGTSKVAAIHSSDFYYQKHQVYCSTGFLYNHESPIRPEKFVSRKIVKTAVEISRKHSGKLFLADLKARIDWGYAPDFVEAMHASLQPASPEKFIIATGIQHSVKDFVVKVFNHLGLNWEDHVQENPAILPANAVKRNLCGDISKIKAMTGWKPKVDFDEMIRILVDEELKGQSKQHQDR